MWNARKILRPADGLFEWCALVTAFVEALGRERSRDI